MGIPTTNSDSNSSIPRNDLDSAASIQTATQQAANKALHTSPPESLASDITNTCLEPLSLKLPSLFQDIAHSATELYATVIQLAEETHRAQQTSNVTKRMSPFELKSWVDTILAILKQSDIQVKTSIEALEQLRESLDVNASGNKTQFFDSILSLFKPGKKEQ